MKLIDNIKENFAKYFSFESPMTAYIAGVLLIFHFINYSVYNGSLIGVLQLKTADFDFYNSNDYWGFLYFIVHTDIFHLSENLVIMLLLGPQLERKYDRGSYITILIVTVLLIAFSNIIFSTGRVIGLSGVVSMMIMAASFIPIDEDEFTKIPFTFLLIAIIFFSKEIYAYRVLNIDSIDYLSHFMGALCGILLGLWKISPQSS